MRVLFMGTPGFARIVLDKLLQDSYFEIVGVFAQPDRPFGRKQEMKPPQTKELLMINNNSIPIYQPEKLDEKSIYAIEKLRPDVILVVAYGKILPKKILCIGRCINLHASILPKYRGASPIQEMILNDEKFYGVSVIDMEEGLDSGNILGIKAFRVKEYLNIESLSIKLANMGSMLIIDILKNIERIQPLKQLSLESTYCKKVLKEDGLILFDDAKKIYLKSLAYWLWPHIFTHEGLKLFDICVVSQTQNCRAGEIISIDQDGVLIGCKCGVIKVQKIQSPSKQKIEATAYVRGKRLKVGDILI
ncbi:methionyl-tRNA formyltransferase [Helicobacter sp. 11S03491-1]|uniref:methionyl-tRNA formyltransferase n=1 Tax=Helicobacter sp. 11S03491-1 TaxID=1476196 RepID=UPI000BA7B88E|nr:methionyl-tRNA formyltransferase [Helicobacter sp. 11S03491-1]PAF41863.1 methionyl-tRNA formyltransferase [Helicobacter sp. 11S03491-1]